MIETKPSRQRDAPPKASPTPAFSALRCATKPENTKVLRGAGALELRVGRSQFNGYFLSQIDALLPQIISLQLFDNFPFG
jgi:hypothetical protein